MDYVSTFSEFIDHITVALTRDGAVGPEHVRMVGIIFASPNSPLAKSEILPRIADWHQRSGEHIDFYFAGYHGPNPEATKAIRVPVPGYEDWIYVPQHFDEFREVVEHYSKWQYSGGCDLLLVNSRIPDDDDYAELDFSSAIVCQLDSMKDDKAITSVEQFFESIFRFAESSKASEPTWGFSDKQGIRAAGSALKRVVLSLLLPGKLDDEVRRAKHFAVRDISRSMENDTGLAD